MIPNRALERQKKTAAEGRFWHITTSPYFELDPRKQGGVVHLTDDAGLAFWAPKLTWPRSRGYVAEIEVNGPIAQTLTPDAHEWQAMSRDCRVVQVLPIEKAIGQTKLAYPDQGGGDPRSWKMPQHEQDILPMTPTPLGPCERCGDGMQRDAEGVYCPSCGYRSNPQAENSRIDMYAPLGEGIGEGPFGLMSKTAINWPWQKQKSPGDWMQWIGDPDKNPFDPKNIPEGWSTPKWMTGEETLEQGIQRGYQKGLEIQKLLESPNPVDYAQGAALHTKSLGYYYPEDEQDQFDSTLQTLMYKFGLEEKDAWHFLSQAWTEQGLSMPSGRQSFSKWTADVWWPSKTAANVQELAEKAYSNLWSRDDMKKLWSQMIDYENLCGQISGREQIDPVRNVRRLDRLIKMILAMYRSGQPEGPAFRGSIHAQGYTNEEVDRAKELAPQLAELQPIYDQAEILALLLKDLKTRYPESYKIWPWAIKQAKLMLREYLDNVQSPNGGRGFFDLTTQWAHFADIVGQAGGLITELRQKNRLPQGFDINQLSYQEVDEWLKAYNAEHVGEGWEERNVWATLPNGWTVEEVKTPNDLQREGELMGHCVGGYCRNVEKGTSLIFSLRDPNGGPHVTFEYKPIYDQVNDDGGPWVDPIWNPQGSKITRLELVQVQGKSDSKPKPEYQQMVAEFNKYLQGEGYQVVWSDNAWRHDRGQNDQQLQQLRHENTYDLRGIEGLHQLEYDYDRNKGTEFFTKQVPDMPDEYGVLSPSGVPEQWLQHPQLQNATDDVLFEIFDGKIKPDQYEEYGRKLIVAWYSLLSQPYASQGRAHGPYSPKSPVDARTWLVQHIGQYGAKLVAAYNESMKGVPGGQWQSQSVIDGMTNLTGFQRTIGDRTGTQMLDWTRPAGIDPDEQVPGTMHYWQNYELHRDQGATMGDYIPQDEPGFHPEASINEYVPYRFSVGKDGRIFGGRFYTHRDLAEHHNLDHDPAWTEVSRGEYYPSGAMQLAEFPNSPFGPEALSTNIHNWAQTLDDPNMPTPSGDVNYNKWIKGQGWDRSRFRIGGWKLAVELAEPMTMPDPNYVMDYNPEDVTELGWKAWYWGTTMDKNMDILESIPNWRQNFFTEGTWEQCHDFLMEQVVPNIVHPEDIRMQIWNATPGKPLNLRWPSYNRTGYLEVGIEQMDRTSHVAEFNAPLRYEEIGKHPEVWNAKSGDVIDFTGTMYHGTHPPNVEPIAETGFHLDFPNTDDKVWLVSDPGFAKWYGDPMPVNVHLPDALVLDDGDRTGWMHKGSIIVRYQGRDRTDGRPYFIAVTKDLANVQPMYPQTTISSWKYSVAGIPANYTEQDPLDLQGKQPIFQNMQADWWKLPPVQQRQAIVNAFRATMLSPRLNLKNNAIMYQEFMSIPADESDPDVFENHARDLKARWDRQGQGDLMNEVEPIGWEKVVPGKLIPGFWGNIRRLAALGPYADDLRQAALDDLNQNGGRGTQFRNEVLKLGIPGVGPKVASFAWLALNPVGSDLATIDVWMMRHLNQDEESPKSPRHYFDLEAQLRDEKDALYGPNTPLGQYQWGVWDKIRTPGFHQDHSPLKVYEPTPYTDVAWSPQYRAPRPQQLLEQHPEQQPLFAAKLADVAKHYRIFYREPGSEDEHVATVKPELVQETLDFYNGRRSVDIDGNPFGEYVAVPYDGFVQGEA
jgi:hypothetical protein